MYSSLTVAPTTAGSAMPASGYIKIKQWNSVAYSAGVLTGVGANATGADVVGWIEVVGQETLTATVNRLNTFKMRGAWYDLGTTDGTRATTYQIPTNGLLQYHPYVEVETGTGTGVYEHYPCAGTLSALVASIDTDAVRGKVCWITTGGVLRFGHDGTNSTGGYIPPSGRKIRIPNIFLANATSAAKTANVAPNNTMANRYEFLTTSGGNIDIDKASCSWYLNLSKPYSVVLTNCGINRAMVADQLTTAIAWDSVCIAPDSQGASDFALTLTSSRAGGTLTGCTFVRQAEASAGHYVVTASDIDEFDFSSCRFKSLTKSVNANTAAIALSRGYNMNFTDCISDGSGRMYFVSCDSITVTNHVYVDTPAGTTNVSAINMYAYDCATKCVNMKFDGITFGGLVEVQPYSGIVNLDATSNSNIKLRNLGSYASPLDLGVASSYDVSWSRATTTATVTSTAHGLKTNDRIYVFICTDTNAITVAQKQITVTGANTFTFNCNNSGATSGTLCYYGQVSGYLVQVTGASSDIYLQRCYTKNNLNQILGGSSAGVTGIVAENVYGSFDSYVQVTHRDSYWKGTGIALFSATTTGALSGVYGTHWMDGFAYGTTANQSGQSWTRSSNTITVTSTSHNLTTGAIIDVTTTSDSTAVPKGQYSITAKTKNTFTFQAGSGTGGTSGTLTFKPFNGGIHVRMNESTTASSSQYTVDAGTPKFTSTGGLYMPTIGDQITFNMPYYMLGHLNFPIAEVVMAGGTISDYTLTYAIDTGSGFSSYKNLYYQRTGAGGSSSSTTVTMTSTTGVAAGDYVWGTGIATFAKVSSVDSSTNITVDTANTGTVSGTLRFNHLPSESDIPSTGAKLKVRILTASTNTNAITNLQIYSYSNDTTRAYQYDLDIYTLTLSGLVTGSDIVIYSAGTETVLASVDSNVGTTYDYVYTSSVAVDIGIFLAGYTPLYIRNYTLETADATLPVAQSVDRDYLA